MLALVALAALPVVNLAGPQDRTRYELTRHVVLYHTLTIEPGFFDRAVYHGKTYSDKAPGMSFLAVPAYEGGAAPRHRPGSRATWTQKGDLSLWLIRVLTSGVLFLVSVFVVGRLAERLVPGTGAVTAAVFGTATLARRSRRRSSSTTRPPRSRSRRSRSLFAGTGPVPHRARRALRRAGGALRVLDRADRPALLGVLRSCATDGTCSGSSPA